jgi:hypothetical protein
MAAGMASIDAPESGSTRMKILELLEDAKFDHVIRNDGTDCDASSHLRFRG